VSQNIEVSVRRLQLLFVTKAIVLVLLASPTEFVDGLKLEDASLMPEISPKNWFLRSQPKADS
jgi:hypothetical protein